MQKNIKNAMEKQTILKSTRSTNRMKQVRYLCSFTGDTKTSIPHILDPDNYDEPIVEEYLFHNDHNDIINVFTVHKDEYMIELNDFAAYIGLSLLETFLFTTIIALQIGKNEKTISINDIGRHLNINGLESMPFTKICENMIDKQYLEQIYDRGECIAMRIPNTIIESIIHNDSTISTNTTKVPFDKYQFCQKVSKLIDDIEQFPTLQEAIVKLEQNNGHLDFIKKLKCMSIGVIDRSILYKVFNNCTECDTSYTSMVLNNIYCGDKHHEIEAIKRFKDGSHKLIQTELLEMHADIFLENSYFTLSDYGKDFFFGEDKIVFMRNNAKSNKKLTCGEDIPVRELFYDKDLKSDIEFIERSIDPDEFKKLQERLTAKSMNKGIAILFYGAPGTGKSETVMQLARRTGRKVYHVNISESKTCWFGESEKLIKGIFTSYKEICKEEPLTPILFFNEADALLGKRIHNINGSCDQTGNAIQNILLEEMEKLEGIMIATTNFECNLDSAFERRFLLKINFRKPSIDNREAIWQYKLPALSSEDCHTLAVKFDFSGGEIDNVARKTTITEVLNGTAPSFETICAMCEKEKLKTDRRAIGF